MSVRVSSRSKRKPPTARAVAKRKVAAKRAKQKRPTKRRGLLARLGWGSVMLTVIAIGVAVFAFSRLNVDETIRGLTLPLKHEDIIRQQAREKDVPADLIAAVINVESGFADQTSEAGARGLMQIT
ncbi:MAG: transglycosylase SLT domain-containing protein, partial [Solirubrobacterales bacterium]